DYLGLLKAAVIAAGIIPPGLEGCGQPLEGLLAQVVGPGLGLEVVSSVNGIPKGSRLAVSTTLLGSLIAACMPRTRPGAPRSRGRGRRRSAAWSPPAPSGAKGWAVGAGVGRPRGASGGE